MPRVLVTPDILNELPGPYRDALESAGLEVVYPGASAFVLMNDPQVLKDHLKGVDAVLASTEPYTPDVLASGRLRVIARMGVGYDSIDIPAATRQGVAVTTTPGTNEHSVAEQTIALITGVLRGFPRRYREVLSGAWTKKSLPRLSGKTLGLVGLGRIGKAVVSRAQGLGLKVIAFDPCCDRAFADANRVEVYSFEDLLQRADIVSLHLPSLPETQDLINARTMAMMKPGSVLINTSRGSLVDEDALCEALKSGHLFGAGLDVYKVEPLPVTHQLLTLDNVLVSPHMGGLDEESEIAMSRLAAQCIVDLYQGRWPDGCVINSTLRETYRW